jgi:hypothetical protein
LEPPDGYPVAFDVRVAGDVHAEQESSSHRSVGEPEVVILVNTWTLSRWGGPRCSMAQHASLVHLETTEGVFEVEPDRPQDVLVARTADAVVTLIFEVVH